MGRKRKDGGSSSSSPDSIWSVDDDNSTMERNEMMKLTKVAKSWDFTCSFCFKKFPSAQAMGGHQNAHRSERLEEKRLYVRDPIAYRKRAFLRAIKAHHSSSTSAIQAGSSSFHAATKMVKNDETAAANFNRSVNYQMRWSCKESSNQKIINDVDVEMMNNKLLQPKELSLVQSVGRHQYHYHAEEEEEDDHREKQACIHFTLGDYGINFDHNLDLTLKL